MYRNINKWQNLNELRRTDPHICGGYYAKNFLKTYRPDFYAEGYDFFPEFVKVAEKDGEIFCRLEEANVPDEDAPVDSDECVFKTSVGNFVSRDYGEFGGVLETPRGEINGNFCDVFELGDRVYAVDSLSHLGLVSTTVYSFDRGCKYHKIFSDEKLDFKARHVTDERAYILLSDRVSCRKKSKIGLARNIRKRRYAKNRVRLRFPACLQYARKRREDVSWRRQGSRCF